MVTPTLEKVQTTGPPQPAKMEMASFGERSSSERRRWWWWWCVSVRGKDRRRRRRSRKVIGRMERK